MLAKLRAGAEKIRLCSEIQCIATSVPLRSPRLPTARGYKLMHVHAQCLLSCAAARAPTIPTARTHLPSGAASHRSASPWRSDMRQWNRRYARTRHAHRRRAKMGCGPADMFANASGQRWPALECSRRESRQRPTTAAGVRRTQQWPTSRIPPPACLSTHGTLAWGAEAARVRIPNGGAQRGGRRRQGFW